MSKTPGLDRKILLEKLGERDASIRGRYLINASSLDSLIRDIISYHFCPPGQDEKRGQFISLILEQHIIKPHIISDVLEKIVTLNYSDQLKKYPALFKDLRDVSDYTLWIASARLDTSHASDFTGQEEFIKLSYYDQNGERRHKDVSLEQIEEKISDCSNLHFALEDIRSEIRDKILTDTR
jgi:hypothetical protein